jgi:hypothetical protein
MRCCKIYNTIKKGMAALYVQCSNPKFLYTVLAKLPISRSVFFFLKSIILCVYCDSVMI